MGQDIKVLKILKFDIPDFDLLVGANISSKEFVKEILKIIKKNNIKIKNLDEIKNTRENACGKMFFNEVETGGYFSAIWLRKYEFNIYWESVLTHEVIHLVDYISEHLGFEDEKEFRAYLAENITYRFKKLHLDKYNQYEKLQKKTTTQKEGKRIKGGKDKKRKTK